VFIVPGRTELILLSWFIVCCECFIHLFSSGVQGRSPSRGHGRRSLPEAGTFLKYTAWNLRPGENERHKLMPFVAYFIAVHCTPALCFFSVSCCTAFGILGGHGPLGPLNPPLRSGPQGTKISPYYFTITSLDSSELPNLASYPSWDRLHSQQRVRYAVA